eukprot:scaffold48_cov311-Pinguiococcus_pyrenoidosus.AAC.257
MDGATRRGSFGFQAKPRVLKWLGPSGSSSNQPSSAPQASPPSAAASPAPACAARIIPLNAPARPA